MILIMRKGVRKKKNKHEIFTFNFVDFEKLSGTLGIVFYNRVVKDFCLYVCCITAVVILQLLLYRMYRQPF